MHCISQEASMRAKQVCALTTTESRAKIWRQLMLLAHDYLDCCPFKGGGSVTVDNFFNVPASACGDSVFGLCFGMRYFMFFLVL